MCSCQVLRSYEQIEVACPPKREVTVRLGREGDPLDCQRTDPDLMKGRYGYVQVGS